MIFDVGIGFGKNAQHSLELLQRMDEFKKLNLQEIEFITYIAKKYGTKARNILENILVKVWSIETEEETLLLPAPPQPKTKPETNSAIRDSRLSTPTPDEA